MSRFRLSCCIAALLPLVLAACATVQQPAAPTALDLINDRMGRAVAAQQELASIASASAQQPRRDRADAFTDKVTLDYVGDIEGLLARIAKQYSFDFEVVGKRPPEGLMVNLYVNEPKTVVDVLRAVALQFPSGVDVNIKKTSIELVYKKG